MKQTFALILLLTFLMFDLSSSTRGKKKTRLDEGRTFTEHRGKGDKSKHSLQPRERVSSKQRESLVATRPTLPVASTSAPRFTAKVEALKDLLPFDTRKMIRDYLAEIKGTLKKESLAKYIRYFDEVASTEPARVLMQRFFDKLTKEDLSSRTVVFWGFEAIVMRRVPGMNLPSMNLKKYQPFVTLWLGLMFDLGRKDFEGLVKTINDNSSNYLTDAGFLKKYTKTLNYLELTIQWIDALKALDAPSNWLTTHAAKHGRLILLGVLIENNYRVTDEAIKLLAEHGDYEHIHMALRNPENATVITDTSYDLLTTAISGNDPERVAKTVRVLLDHGVTPNMDHMFQAVHNHLALSLICDAMMLQSNFLSELHGKHLFSHGSIWHAAVKAGNPKSITVLGEHFGTQLLDFPHLQRGTTPLKEAQRSNNNLLVAAIQEIAQPEASKEGHNPYMSFADTERAQEVEAEGEEMDMDWLNSRFEEMEASGEIFKPPTKTKAKKSTESSEQHERPAAIITSTDSYEEDSSGTFPEALKTPPTSKSFFSESSSMPSTPEKPPKPPRDLDRIELIPSSAAWQIRAIDSDDEEFGMDDDVESATMDDQGMYSPTSQDSSHEYDSDSLPNHLSSRQSTTTQTSRLPFVIDTSPISTPTAFLPTTTWMMDPRTGALLRVPDESEWGLPQSRNTGLESQSRIK